MGSSTVVSFDEVPPSGGSSTVVAAGVVARWLGGRFTEAGGSAGRSTEVGVRSPVEEVGSIAEVGEGETDAVRQFGVESAKVEPALTESALTEPVLGEPVPGSASGEPEVEAGETELA